MLLAITSNTQQGRKEEEEAESEAAAIKGRSNRSDVDDGGARFALFARGGGDDAWPAEREGAMREVSMVGAAQSRWGDAECEQGGASAQCRSVGARVAAGRCDSAPAAAPSGGCSGGRNVRWAGGGRGQRSAQDAAIVRREFAHWVRVISFFYLVSCWYLEDLGKSMVLAGRLICNWRGEILAFDLSFGKIFWYENCYCVEVWTKGSFSSRIVDPEPACALEKCWL